MQRLAITGSSLATPELALEDLKNYLNGLGLKYSKTPCRIIYQKLEAMIGRWWQEQESMQADAVAKALLSVCRNVDDVCRIVGGNRTGFQQSNRISAAVQLRQLLAQDPEVGSPSAADRLMAQFLKDAGKIAEHGYCAYADLTAARGPTGRPKITWYDDFTQIVIELAREAGVKPTISTDRSSGERRGWILIVAGELENFLPRPMRSPSVEARAKRLVRSKRNIRAAQGQKGSAR